MQHAGKEVDDNLMLSSSSVTDLLLAYIDNCQPPRCSLHASTGDPALVKNVTVQVLIGMHTSQYTSTL